MVLLYVYPSFPILREREREIRKSADNFFPFLPFAQTFIRDEVQAAASSSSSPSHKSDVTRDFNAKEERGRGRTTTTRERQ